MEDRRSEIYRHSVESTLPSDYLDTPPMNIYEQKEREIPMMMLRWISIQAYAQTEMMEGGMYPIDLERERAWNGAV